MSFFKKKRFLFIFRERGREREREEEKHQCVVASHVPPTGDLACNPGLGIELVTPWCLVDPLRPTLNPLSNTSQGLLYFLTAFLLYLFSQLPILKDFKLTEQLDK